MKRVPPPLPPRGRRPTPSGGPPARSSPQQRVAASLARPPTPPVGVPAVNPEAAAAGDLPPMRPPMPSSEGFMTGPDMLSLAEFAYALRNEQVQAKVALYKADLATNPELDAITARVVAELYALQQQAAREGSIPPPSTTSQLETELTSALTTHLGRLFRQGKLASVLLRKLAETSKRFARLFFESELHEKIHGARGELKTMRFAEQALYRVLTRYEQHLLLELESFEYEEGEVLDRAKSLYENIVRELRNKYLGRTTPELNLLVSHLNETMNVFLTQEFPPLIPDFAKGVVREARLGDGKLAVGYKVSADGFARMRVAFERRFLQKLVPYVEEEMLKWVRARNDKFRAETIRFVADPQIFSEACELICDATYDYLYNEGFLDLPDDWRARLADEG